MRNHLPFRALLPSVFTLISTFLLIGCEKEHTDDFLDPALANSPKLETYVIAKYDLQQSITEFRYYLSKIDFTKLEWVEESGRMVMHLSGRPPKIEAKVAALNEANAALLGEFPQIASLSIQAKGDYVQYCTQNSIAVNDKLLDLGINAYQAITKRPVDEWGNVMDFLDNHMGSPNYVEAVIIGYADGGSYIFIDSRNTPNRAYYPMFTRGADGLGYYPQGGNNSAVVMVAHTHRYSSNPSKDDTAVRYSEFAEAIYYNGSFYRYNND